MSLTSIDSLRKVLGIMPILLVTTLLSLPAFAQEAAVQENSEQIQVKYLDGDNEALHFNLKYHNNSGNLFKLMVLNETGDILFQNNYSGKNFRKKIKLARLTDTDGVTFLIRSPKENVQHSYKVKVPSKVIDEADDMQ